MSLSTLMTQFLRPKSAPQAKTSRAGPMIAYSQVGHPQWTPRKMANLAEEGFRKNSIAYRCVMQIANAAAAVPFMLYDERGNDIDAHPLLDLLTHPNPMQDGVSFIETLYADLQIFGNAYVEAIRPRDNAPPVELYALRPERMKVIPGASGLPQGYQYNVNGQVTTWGADPITGDSDILHLKQFNPLDDWYGLAPMEAALHSIDQHNASGAWNQALLNQGARPSGALVYAPKDGGPATLSDDQLQRLREEMGLLYQGDRNAGRPLILEGGLDWREMSLSPKDMDWLSGRNNAARDIAHAFGVPAQLVGLPDAQTYGNYEQARLAFYEETILPLLTRVTAAIDHWLCPMYPDPIELDFDPDSISALNDKRQAQWAKLQNANFLTRNEKRAAAGYGPVAGGDDDDDTATANDNQTEAGNPTAFFNPKFNPYHDELGRFTFGPGGEDDESDDDSQDQPHAAPQTQTPAPNSQEADSSDSTGSGYGVFGLPADSTQRPVIPVGATEPSITYPTSSIGSMEDAQQVVADADGNSIGKNSQCASLVHALAPELPPTPQWQPGDRVQGNTDIPVGTPIATFNFQGDTDTNGYGSPDHPTGEAGQSHSGIYLGQNDNGMSLLSQWRGSGGPQIRTIPWSSWGANASEGGSRYYTIDY